jgi:UDP-3-O-[3-hydroxymyristoyl] N-acetylglucosamine deacetylase / 3-hydroxyacyl-[acyl-carrier-protein] dehydratase
MPKKYRISMKQRTIKKEVSIEGIGLHTGKNVNLIFKPAAESTGIKFIRTDLEGEPVIEALAYYVVDTQRGTNLEKNGVVINTSEHVLAAIIGLDIDNIIIEMDSPEPPIMDGSSKYFVEKLEEAGIETQDSEREVYEVKEIISYKDEESGSEIMLMPSDKYEITTMVDFGTKILGTQNATLKNISDFKKEIAGARTFSFLHEIEMLLDNDLIKGGDLNNAIVYVDKKLSKETMKKLSKAFKKDSVKVKPNGILDNLTLHWANEAARHKLLDVIGDLALVGTKIKGKVIATKPGHKINTHFAKKLMKMIKIEKRNKVPHYDLNQPPLMDIHKIMSILPHRPPFLLIDRILELSEKHVVGMKNVTMNESFFVGHFPDAPVMPGVLQVEAMAQCGGILVLSTVPDPENYLTYFMKMDNVKFKQMVLPGDTLIFKAELVNPIRRGICHMQAYGYANNKLVVEAELMAQILKNKNKENTN